MFVYFLFNNFYIKGEKLFLFFIIHHVKIQPELL